MAYNSRRLPVYLLLDCSSSMRGEPIEAVKQGLKTLISELKDDPMAIETAYISVITFDGTARQVTPLTELMSFTEPELETNFGTAMGGAIETLIDCMDSEIVKNTETQKGDYRPLVFILTDGYPSDVDVLNRAAAALKAKKCANVVACAAGAHANTSYLKQITDNVLMMNTLSAGEMAKFFKWMSISVKTTSHLVENVANDGGGIALPPPPQGFIIIP